MWSRAQQVIVYSVLDGEDRRRLETLSESEAEQHAYTLKKDGGHVVTSRKFPSAWRRGVEMPA